MWSFPKEIAGDTQGIKPEYFPKEKAPSRGQRVEAEMKNGVPKFVRYLTKEEYEEKNNANH